MAKVLVNESSLTGIADAIRGKNGSTDTYKPSEMAAAITAISGGGEPTIEALSITANGTYTAPDGVDGYSPVTVNVPQDGGPPESVFVISGDCSYRFAQGGWDWFINQYGNKITTKDITSCVYMFSDCNLTQIPFDINLNSSEEINLNNMFNSNKLLTTLPAINNNNNSTIRNMNNFFGYSEKIKNIPDNYFSFINKISLNGSFNGCFNSMSSLRNIPTSFNLIVKLYNRTSGTGSFYFNMCNSCYCLDEITNLGVITLPTLTSNAFNSIVYNCTRLKNFTFETGKVVRWRNQEIDLSYNIGYGIYSNVAEMNGISATKLVNSAESYAALKNDPDWFTSKKAYSRYNHDSAVATINSLPDTSAYLATAGGTNIIMLEGAAGSATDGGAINTLTEEEIAVATAKGWSVSLV